MLTTMVMDIMTPTGTTETAGGIRLRRLKAQTTIITVGETVTGTVVTGATGVTLTQQPLL